MSECKLDQTTYNAIVDFVSDNVPANMRQHYTSRAFGGTPLPNLLETGGNQMVFASHLVSRADQFGQIREGLPAVAAFLLALRPDVGKPDKQTEIDALLARIPCYVPEKRDPPERVFQKADARKVFISYRSLDRPLIRGLEEALEGIGSFDVWYDQELIGGQKWWPTIMQAIRECDVALLALSPDYLTSEACTLERQYAAACQRALVPVRVRDDLDYGGLPASLSSRQIIPYTGGAADLVALLKALNNAQPGTLPDPLPDEPPAPGMQLAEMRDLLEQASLTLDQQKDLLDSLRWYSRENPGEGGAVCDMLNRLQNRRDVMRSVSDLAADLQKTLGCPTP